MRFSLESLFTSLRDFDYNEATEEFICNIKRKEWRNKILVCSKGIIKFLLDNTNDYKFFDIYNYERQESTKALFDDYLYNRWDEFCDFLSYYVEEIGYERWEVYDIYDTSKEFCQGRILTTIVEEFKKNSETLEALSEGDYLNESDFRVLDILADDFITYLEDIRAGKVLPDWAVNFAHQTSAVNTDSGGAANEAMPHAMKSKPAKGGKNELPQMPAVLDTKKVREAIEIAIKKGWMKNENGKLLWIGLGRGKVSQLAYFFAKIFGYEISANGNKGEELPWGAVEEVFGGKAKIYGDSLYNMGYSSERKVQPWEKAIDEALKNIVKT